MNKIEKTRFSSVVEGVEQAAVNRFGALHGTTGKTHTDPDYARQHGFGGTIVQGAFVMAPIMEMGYELFGDVWFDGATIECKFISYTRPGDQISVEFEVEENTPISCQLSYTCRLLDGKVVQVGTITHREQCIRIPK